MLRIRACGLSDVGLTRVHNEDYFQIDPRHRLYVVADGMGGHSAGEVAAQIAVKAIHDFIEQSVGRDSSSWALRMPHFPARTAVADAATATVPSRQAPTVELASPGPQRPAGAAGAGRGATGELNNPRLAGAAWRGLWTGCFYGRGSWSRGDGRLPGYCQLPLAFPLCLTAAAGWPARTGMRFACTSGAFGTRTRSTPSCALASISPAWRLPGRVIERRNAP